MPNTSPRISGKLLGKTGGIDFVCDGDMSYANMGFWAKSATDHRRSGNTARARLGSPLAANRHGKKTEASQVKRGATEHPKLLALCSMLNVEKCTAVGILELMWHFTAKFAPQGDIGRYSDAAIAKAVDWKRPTGAKGVTPECKLSGALVMAKWLDSDPVHRLIVHDWKDHCDEAVKKFLSRHGLDFVRPVDRLPLPLPLPLPEPYATSDIGQTAERMYALHPKKKNKPLVEHALVAIAEKSADPSERLAEIEACHRLWCATEEWNEKNGQFAPKLDEWLMDEGYTKRPREHEAVRLPMGWTTEQYQEAMKKWK